MIEVAMQIRPIQTEQDYDEALARIAKLMGSGLATPEGDELDRLARLLDAYEAEHFPIDAPDREILAIEQRESRRIQTK